MFNLILSRFQNVVSSLSLEAIRMKDVSLVVGVIAVLTACFTIIMMLVDLACATVDLRVKAQYIQR